MKLYIRDKSFGEKRIFSELTLTLNPGERIAITGTSGKGKTTLLRIISGLDKNYDGSLIDPFTSVSYLFQEDRLSESLTVFANLKAVTTDKEKANRLLSLIGLEKERDSLVSTLSGGMKRRVAIVRSLLLDHSLLLLDEPFTGLDDISKERAASLILSESKASSIILVSHDKEDAELLSINNSVEI